MRNTPIPLDIIFIGKNKQILNIAANAKPMSDCSYVSHGPTQYVVEVPAGFSKKYELKKGMGIEWERITKTLGPDPTTRPSNPYLDIYEKMQ
jgi:uncharacterized membrane protein (UPF0127 family)